jgi:hypothetical protein
MPKTKRKTTSKKLSKLDKKPLLFIIVFAILGAIGITFSLAAPPALLIFNNIATDIQNPVEQQSPNYFYCGGTIGPINCAFDPSTWVNNHTGCAWDVDDVYSDLASSGLVRANSTATDSHCLITDGRVFHKIQIMVQAPTSALTVKLENTAGLSWTVPAVKAGSAYKYALCVSDDTPGPYIVIDGSNGGTGRLVNYTLSITNATKRDVKSIMAEYQIGHGSFAVTC